jgi:hypothetical protein
MSKIPFERFIIALLLFNKDLPWIVNKCKAFGYHITEAEVKELFDDLRQALPESLKTEVNSRVEFAVTKPEHMQWLEHFGVAEVYHYLANQGKKSDEPPPYFKWLADIVWMHNNHEVLTIVNILMFNGEELASISDVILFKFKKKIGVDALELHKSIFWNTEVLSAKEALYHCIPFKSNALCIKRTQGSYEANELLGREEAYDGSVVSFVFHNNEYVKWKVGYKKDLRVPTARDFLEAVKTDSYIKYYEAMNMSQSIEIETEEGSSDELGGFTKTRVRRRNVEEQKAKAAKHWMDLFIKADKAIPAEGADDNDFFERMNQLELGFDIEEEKIVGINEVPEILNDIKSDM